jgi:type I restriction enzyme, S subunit
MSPAQLVVLFDRVSEAPGAIPRLRLFILDLAVRGKLVEQVWGEEVSEEYRDEPTSDTFPENWRLLNFGKFCNIQGGNQPPKSQFVDETRPGYVRLFQIRDLGDSPVPTYIPINSTNRFCSRGEILIGRYGASVGKVFWAQEGAYNVALAKFLYPQSAFTPEFAFLLVKSKFFQTKLAGATRSAQAGFNKGDLAEINMPMPPLAEQHRIIAKMDELTALCDRLEAAQAERESRRDQLASSCLYHFGNGESAETFGEHASFYLSHLPRLTARGEQIEQLRKAVLNLAVRGKLVPQDPGDEPVSELLKRIHSGKAQRDTAGISEDTIPFPLPPGWQWVRFGQIIRDADAGWSPKCEGFPRAGDNWGVLKVSAVSWDEFLPDENKQLLPDVVPPERARVRLGDFLISRANTSELVAKCVVVKEEPRNLILSDKIVRLQIAEECNKQFVCMVNNYADYARSYYAEEASGTSLSMKNVSRAVIYCLAIPLPPAAEQRRIVDKVDELMALCDRLEEQLTIAQSESGRLLEAVLSQALQYHETVESIPTASNG